MKRIWIDVDDGIEYKEALDILKTIPVDDEFVKGMGVEEYDNSTRQSK